jgi:hypothetical protein
MRSAQQLKFLHFIRGRGRKLRQHSIDIALERRSHPAKPPSKSLSEFDAQADPPAVANVQVTTPEGFQEYPQGSHNGTRRLAHRLLAGDPRRRRSSSFSGAAAHQCHHLLISGVPCKACIALHNPNSRLGGISEMCYDRLAVKRFAAYDAATLHPFLSRMLIRYAMFPVPCPAVGSSDSDGEGGDGGSSAAEMGGGRPRIRFRRGAAHQRLMGRLSCSPLVKYSIVT